MPQMSPLGWSWVLLVVVFVYVVFMISLYYFCFVELIYEFSGWEVKKFMMWW